MVLLCCHLLFDIHAILNFVGTPSPGCLEPKRLDYMSGKKIKQIAFGAGPHVLALSEDGRVYSWGKNASGQLGKLWKFSRLIKEVIGLGHTLQGTSPTLVQGPLTGERVKQVACGAEHSVAITDRGEVFTWGQNSSGQLGEFHITIFYNKYVQPVN